MEAYIKGKKVNVREIRPATEDEPEGKVVVIYTDDKLVYHRDGYEHMVDLLNDIFWIA